MFRSQLIILSLFFFILNTPQIRAQNAIDALRYSLFEVNGTARTVGVGGALGAFGTDFATISVNPAGLGMSRSSEFTISPNLIITGTESDFLNANPRSITDDSRTSFNLANLGLVFNSRPRSRNWRTSNIAFGFNQIANFNQRFTFDGVSVGSYTDRFLELANSDFGIDIFEAGPAVDAGALFDFTGDGFFESDLTANTGTDYAIDRLEKRQEVTTRGSINELVFGFAGNYKEKFAIGASIGVPLVNYESERRYFESEGDMDIPFYDALTFDEDLTVSGVGINLKIGAIFIIDKQLRAGVAIHTPTFYRITEEFSTSLTYDFTNIDGDPISNTAESGLVEPFDYSLATPWRFVGSLGYIIAKKGFLSAEIDYANYTGARFGFDEFQEDEDIVNQEIDDQLQSAINLRFGGEFAYQRYRFRGGFGLHYSALVADDNVDYSYSVGAGARWRSYYIDLAYRYLQRSQNFSPYLLSASERQQFIDNTITNSQVLLTLGYRF